MSTRSSIAKFNEDGTVTSVYSHWDGYPEHNGELLQEHYNNDEAVDSLLELGDISSLRKNLAPAEGQEHTFDKAADDVTIFYGRDRGEKGCEPRTHEGIAAWIKMRKDSWAEFFYLWKDGAWLVASDSDESQLAPLTETLAKIKEQDNG